MRNVVPIRSRDFKMDPDALRQALDALVHGEGKRIMAVVATAGSTPTGSFDDVDAIASACDHHGVLAARGWRPRRGGPAIDPTPAIVCAD
jgi:glutamate/tyrosine decarboxylase-like PLP-dependent enzyme